MIWFLGCEHYHHRNIIHYTKRPFADIAEMDDELVSRFQSVVLPTDLTYHLGDFGFGPVVDLAEMIDGLPGTHILIKGNHDRGPDAMREVGFKAVLESAVVSLMGRKIWLSHRPLQFLPDGVDGVFHAHVHNADPANLHAAEKCAYIQPFCLNLSVEAIDYRPISFRAALKRLDAQKKMGALK